MLGDEIILMRPELDQTLRLTRKAAEAFTSVQTGRGTSGVSPDILQSLVEQGVLSNFSSRDVSRRGLVTGAAAGFGAGVVALALPTVAVASSQEVLSGLYNYTNETNYFYALLFHNFPTSLGDTGDNPAPGPLLDITGVTGTFENTWSTSGPQNQVGANGVDWLLEDGGTVNLIGEGVITTSFVWDGVTYPLRLVYDATAIRNT